MTSYECFAAASNRVRYIQEEMACKCAFLKVLTRKNTDPIDTIVLFKLNGVCVFHRRLQ